MDITASMVKELRDKTEAGMMDCKNALVEKNGNMDDAIDYLREKGVLKAAKKADRIAAEGLANIYIDNNKAVILEVNSETDFVAKNDKFVALIDLIGNTILKNNVFSIEDALKLKSETNTTLEEEIVNATATIGEKLDLRRFTLVSKTEQEVFGSYLHMGGKIASLVILDGTNQEVAKDIAMQAAAMRPTFALREEVSNELINHEKEVLKEQAINEGKTPEIAEKMVNGRLEKFFKEICLNEQQFIKDSDVTIKDHLKNNKCVLKTMIRYEVGEGIEKKEDNLAEEVAKQIGEKK